MAIGNTTKAMIASSQSCQNISPTRKITVRLSLARLVMAAAADLRTSCTSWVKRAISRPAPVWWKKARSALISRLYIRC